MEKASALAGREWPVSTGSGRSSREGGGGPPKVVEGHGRSRVTYKGQETPRVPLHHVSQVPLPQRGRIANVAFQPKRIAANALLKKIRATIPSATPAPSSRPWPSRSGALLLGARWASGEREGKRSERHTQ